MRKGKSSVFTYIGLLMLACLLVVDRFVVVMPDWVAIIVALVALVCIFIGFRKTADKCYGRK
ncbi:MAG: hypothetical protein E7331_06035 [Clostridiales bacterium]|nr:hypothetical protein [Clostridiales bacterium]